MLSILYRAITRIVPYDTIHILEVDAQTESVSTIDKKNDTVYPLSQGGILSQCYHSKQPLLINDVAHSLLYNQAVDKLDLMSVDKILVVPILSNDESKTILGIIWIAISKGYQQFIKQDIDDLVRFGNSIKQYLFLNDNVESKEDQRLINCQERHKILETKMKREENYFASTIHDIRTPMNAVIGFMELMLMNETDAEKIEYLEASLKSGEQMVSLINDALDMSKVSNGKMNIDKKLFSPLVDFGDIARLFYNSMKQKSIDFEIYIDPLLPQLIQSDLYRIKQIVNNLLSNAMKFTPNLQRQIYAIDRYSHSFSQRQWHWCCQRETKNHLQSL